MDLNSGAAIVAASTSGSTACLELLLEIPDSNPMFMDGAALKAAAENGFDSTLLLLIKVSFFFLFSTSCEIICFSRTINLLLDLRISLFCDGLV